MAFEFKQQESVRKAVKRLWRKAINDALCDLKRCERLEAIRQVRKEIKHLRALLRLVRNSIPQSQYRRSSKRLRKLASNLSAARDAKVRVNALEGLTSKNQSNFSPRSFQNFHRTLLAKLQKQEARLTKTFAARKIARALRNCSRRAGSLKLKASGWDAIGPGIENSYRQGRRAFCQAHNTGVPEYFHKWRKHVKDLDYYFRLLCPLWPEQMGAAQAELKRLGSLLGSHHDLFLLTEPRVMKHFEREAPPQARALEALVKKRQKEFEAQALALGEKFYAEKPDIFCARLKRYWKRWRRGSDGTCQVLQLPHADSGANS